MLFVVTDEFSVRVTKLLQGLVSCELAAYLFVFTRFFTHLAILSKGCKSDNFEPHNSLKLSFANMRGLHSNFNVNLSLNQPLLTFLLSMRQTWMTQLILAISL